MKLNCHVNGEFRYLYFRGVQLKKQKIVVCFCIYHLQQAFIKENNSIVQPVELLRISKHFLSKQFPDLPDSAHVHLQDTVNVTFVCKQRTFKILGFRVFSLIKFMQISFHFCNWQYVQQPLKAFYCSFCQYGKQETKHPWPPNVYGAARASFWQIQNIHFQHFWKEKMETNGPLQALNYPTLNLQQDVP